MDITTIILTYNEEKHLLRCIQSIEKISQKIIICDSYSSDNTKSIARKFNVDFIQRHWPGNQANQLNWVLDNIEIKTNWVFRIDADEYLSQELAREILYLNQSDKTITHYYIKRNAFFLNKRINYGGTNDVQVLRLWKKGTAYCENRMMDEHMISLNGSAGHLKNELIDNNLQPLKWWIKKHKDYSKREVVSILNSKFSFYQENYISEHLKNEPSKKRRLKSFYLKLPPIIRPTLLFLYRFIIKLGFLDGTVGFKKHFLQSFWYRLIIDIELIKIYFLCMNNKSKVKKYIKNHYKINLQ